MSTKSNVGPLPPALVYRLVPAENGVARISWEGVSQHTATALLATPKPEQDKSALEEARAVLSSILEYGPLAADQVLSKAAQAGVSRASLRRAKLALGVRSRKYGYLWQWELPAPERTFSS